MIHAVRCDRPSFRDVVFEDGLNVVLADRTQESTRKDTRNGLGKSTLIDIIHFCLGGNRENALAAEEIRGWIFTLDFDAGGRRIAVSRDTAHPTTVTVEADSTGWPVQPTRTRQAEPQLSNADWKAVLGSLSFGLDLADKRPNRPQFRGLVSYFARRGRDAYSVPFEHHRKQKTVERQVLNSFLLGLESDDALEFQRLKDRATHVGQLEKAAKAGVFERFVGSLGELEAVKVRLEGKVEQEEVQLREFRVHPQYEEIAARANVLTEISHELANQNVVDKRLLDLYEQSLRDERPPEQTDVARVYQEAGVALSGSVQRRLEDVQKFHQTLIENRRSYLASELERLRRTIQTREREIEQSTAERASLMKILQTHGALEEYTRLQQLHLRIVAELEDVQKRIENLRQFEEGRSEVKIQQQQLLQRARRDLDDRSAARQKATEIFNQYSQALYSAPGTLAVNIDDKGFRFDVAIERSGSEGIDSMKIFCYDLMLARLRAESYQSPGFLIHDSTLFDGVDSRQVALALELAQKEAEDGGFQYICALNSDTLPTGEFSEGFTLAPYVRLTLTDDTPAGSLLGIRF